MSFFNLCVPSSLLALKQASITDISKYTCWYDGVLQELTLFHDESYYTQTLSGNAKLRSIPMLSLPIEGASSKKETPVCIKFSIDKTLVAIQKKDGGVDIVDVADGKEWAIKSSDKGEVEVLPGGLIWCDLNLPLEAEAAAPSLGTVQGQGKRSPQHLVLVTKQGMEVHRVSVAAKKGILIKLVKTVHHNVATFWWECEKRVLFLCTGTDGNTIRGFSLTPQSSDKYPKVLLPHSNINHDDVYVACLYDSTYLLYITPSKSLHVYNITKEKSELVKVYSLQGCHGPFQFNIVDSIIIVHDIHVTVSLLFDIRSPGTSPLLNPLPISIYEGGSNPNDYSTETVLNFRNCDEDILELSYETITHTCVDDGHLSSFEFQSTSKKSKEGSEVIVKGFRPLPDGSKSTAEEAGTVSEGDHLTAINGIPVTDLTFEECCLAIEKMISVLKYDKNPPPVVLQFERRCREISPATSNSGVQLITNIGHGWIFHYPDLMIHESTGDIYQLDLNLKEIKNLILDPFYLTALLLNRTPKADNTHAKNVLLSFLRGKIREKASLLTIHTIFYICHDVYMNALEDRQSRQKAAVPAVSPTNAGGKKDSAARPVSAPAPGGEGKGRGGSVSSDSEPKTNRMSSIRMSIRNLWGGKTAAVAGPEDSGSKSEPAGTRKNSFGESQARGHVSPVSSPTSGTRGSDESPPHGAPHLGSHTSSIAVFGGGSPIAEDDGEGGESPVIPIAPSAPPLKVTIASPTKKKALNDILESSLSHASSIVAVSSSSHTLPSSNGGSGDKKNESKKNSIPALKDLRDRSGSAVLLQVEVYYRVLVPLSEEALTYSQRQYLSGVIKEFMASLLYHNISVESYIVQLLADLLFLNKDYQEMEELINNKVVTDSEIIAEKLLETSSQYERFFRISLDMFKRLSCHKRVVEIMLDRGIVNMALQYVLHRPSEFSDISIQYRRYFSGAVKHYEQHQEVSVFHLLHDFIKSRHNTAFVVFPGGMSASSFAQDVLVAGLTVPMALPPEERKVVTKLFGFPV